MKKNNIKKAIAIAVMSTAIIGAFSTGASAAWKKDSSGWWYTEGNSWATGWRQIDGKWYYFSPTNGYMYLQTTVNGCYVNEDGAWVDDRAYNVTVAKAQELVKKYLADNGKFVPPFIICSGEKDNSWIVHCYEDMETHTATYAWYFIDKSTRKIVDMNSGKVLSSGINSSSSNVTNNKNIDSSSQKQTLNNNSNSTNNAVYDECLAIAKAYFENSHSMDYRNKYTVECDKKLNDSGEYTFLFYNKESRNLVDGCYVNSTTKNTHGVEDLNQYS